MSPEELIIFGIIGIGFWVILIIGAVAVPFLRYLKTGKVWTLSFFHTSYIILQGKKAGQNLLIRLSILCGCGYLFVSMIMFNRFAWEAALVVFVLSIIGIIASFGEKRVPRKSVFWRR